MPPAQGACGRAKSMDQAERGGLIYHDQASNDEPDETVVVP